MIDVAVNPEGMDEHYLKSLNVCFSGWGDRQKYDWYFRRKTSYPDADLIILTQDNKLAAGSAVTYRRVAFANDSEVTVGNIDRARGRFPSFAIRATSRESSKNLCG